MPEALIVIDVQAGFEDPRWGTRNNPACEENVAQLIGAWTVRSAPIVLVRHDSTDPSSPLRPGVRGNSFKSEVNVEGDLLVTKHVHSAFHGSPHLEAWLRSQDIEGVVICGIQTNMCCETTARLASDLGFAMTFAIDATHTFDLPTVSADHLTAATAATLAADFGRVARTAALV